MRLTLNLNPLQNPMLLSNRAIVYVLPRSELDAFQVAVHHILVNAEDTITFASESRLMDGDNIVAQLDPTELSTGLELFRELYPKNLIIGTASITRECSISDLNYVDVRENGGGLANRIEDNLPNFINDYPELQWISEDSISGRPIPMMESAVVRLPFEILEEGGGAFSREDVESIVRLHMALGSHPIIQYFADTPEVQDVAFMVDPGIVTFTWSSTNAETYNIYVGGSPTEGFTVIQSEGTTDTIFPNSLHKTVFATDLDVALDGKFYVYVAPVNDGHEWPAGHMVEVDIGASMNRSISMLDSIIGETTSQLFAMDAIIGAGV